MDKLKELDDFCKDVAWYGGERVLYRIELRGEFEGYSGRASETWEHKYVLTSDEVKVNSGNGIPQLYIEGKSIEEVCGEAINQLIKILKEKRDEKE